MFGRAQELCGCETARNQKDAKNQIPVFSGRLETIWRQPCGIYRALFTKPFQRAGKCFFTVCKSKRRLLNRVAKGDAKTRQLPPCVVRYGTNCAAGQGRILKDKKNAHVQPRASSPFSPPGPSRRLRFFSSISASALAFDHWLSPAFFSGVAFGLCWFLLLLCDMGFTSSLFNFRIFLSALRRAAVDR